MHHTATTAQPHYRLVDADGNVIARRTTVGALRNFARLSNAGKRAVAILSPTGESFPVVKPKG